MSVAAGCVVRTAAARIHCQSVKTGPISVKAVLLQCMVSVAVELEKKDMASIVFAMLVRVCWTKLLNGEITESSLHLQKRHLMLLPTLEIVSEINLSRYYHHLVLLYIAVATNQAETMHA